MLFGISTTFRFDPLTLKSGQTEPTRSGLFTLFPFTKEVESSTDQIITKERSQCLCAVVLGHFQKVEVNSRNISPPTDPTGFCKGLYFFAQSYTKWPVTKKLRLCESFQ